MGCASDDDSDFDYEGGEGGQTNVFNSVGDQHAAAPEDLSAFADECCKEFGLDGALREDVFRTANLPLEFLLIRLYALTLASEKHLKTAEVDSFLTSREFKETVTRRLQEGLLDPHIPHYVEGTTARFVRHITQNPALYEIPAAVQAQFMHSKPFSSAIGKVLCSFRGELQRKLQRSVIDKEDIDTLASRFAVHGFQIRHEHLLRIAFLRAYYLDFISPTKNKAVQSRGDNTNNNRAETKFWSFIDAKLDKFRQKSPEHCLRLLEGNLTNDRRMFPSKGGAPVILSEYIAEREARDISIMAGYQAATPVKDRASRSGATSGRRPGDSSSKPRPSTEVGSPIRRPKVEQLEGGETLGPVKIASNRKHPTQAYVLPKRRGIKTDSDYGAGLVSYPLHSAPGGAPTHTETTSVRRGASQGMSVRGSSRHNPISTTGRLLTSPCGQPSNPKSTGSGHE